MASAKRDRRRADIAKFLEAYHRFGVPAGSAAEQAVWVILARHGSKEGAGRALRALWRRYVDANELRVAKAIEIAGIVQRHVKNDAVRVAEQIRGFLRRWHRDQHTDDFSKAAELTPDQMKKYLSNVEGFAQEIALTLFLHFCGVEEAQAAAVAASGDGKPKKRPEKEVTLSANRLRLFSTFAAFGKATVKALATNNARALTRAWSYAPLPAAGAASRKTARKTAKKKAAKAAKTAKTAKKASTATRGGGTARPRTTRTARTPRKVKKSSRR